MSTSPVLLHPLIVVAMCDHYTRLSLNNPETLSSPTVAYGVLYECVNPSTLELRDCDELPLTGSLSIDATKLKLVNSLHTEVFPTHCIAGVYKVGAPPTAHDMALLKDLDNTSAVLVRLNPVLGGKELPIEVYRVEEAAGSDVFVDTDFKVISEDAESVGITNVISNHAAVVEGGHGGHGGAAFSDNHLKQHLDTTVSMADRLAAIIEYLELVNAGVQQPDYELLRKINTIVTQGNVKQHESVKRMENREYEEALCCAFMAVVGRIGGGMREVGKKAI
jgi:hypothetical protein